jgi:hypothetical protein
VRRHGVVSLMLAVVSALVSGCASSTAYYDIGLSQVQTTFRAPGKYGEPTTKRAGDPGVDEDIYVDGLIGVGWLLSPRRLSFLLGNHTDRSIRVIWDQAAYVDATGVTHRVMHEGVKYIDRSASQPPSVVVPGGKLFDSITPADHVYLMSGQYGGWGEAPLLPVSGYSKEQLEAIVEQYVGKTLQVLLPIEIQGFIVDYIFTFRINRAEVR